MTRNAEGRRTETSGVVATLHRIARTVARLASEHVRQTLRRSHVRRWASMDLTSDEWDERAIMMARLVPPGVRVLEFGAGRMTLRKHLPANCEYIPVDIVEREPGMIVCDLNSRRIPEFPDCDVAFFSGVLEYVYDVPRLLRALPTGCSCIIASYASADKAGQSRPATRIQQGWVNHYTPEELQRVLEGAGFVCAARDRWRSHDLFKFVRKEAR